ncbi:WecB/TagA/CpsF family glycosyltransferase [Neobacillus sp. PS2-9]|uniref:WecB/TagA/CpsF family glycosyltransferase n=1 Tax=Neobacillus sp. PS2-9 TaxID=3070676 RepID=UPI0027DFF17C|nr:WecB/TagA/CpsF family glycosyltransferase [Neobacillus sp. PS2-9]WML59034.1 WecB/TagA/CpsF family glycosyltransferase [Neobacillus sp. PS2-9]
MKENFLGVDVCNYDYDQLASLLMKDIETKKKSFIVAINPEKIMKAQEDVELRKLLNRADYQIPDGIGVILASKLKGGQVKSRVTGIDMMLKLCQTAAAQGKRIFLYGGKPGVADAAKAELEKQIPGINIVGTLHGYEKDEEVIIKTINQHDPEIMFVALGSPAQEYWIVNHMDQVAPYVFQGVGGSYDVISGNLKRAPEVFQSLGLEWFYRLVKEPWRWKRQLILPKFLLRTLKK